MRAFRQSIGLWRVSGRYGHFDTLVVDLVGRARKLGTTISADTFYSMSWLMFEEIDISNQTIRVFFLVSHSTQADITAKLLNSCDEMEVPVWYLDVNVSFHIYVKGADWFQIGKGTFKTPSVLPFYTWFAVSVWKISAQQLPLLMERRKSWRGIEFPRRRCQIFAKSSVTIYLHKLR